MKNNSIKNLTRDQIRQKLRNEYQGKSVLDIGVGENKVVEGAIGLDFRENIKADVHHDLNTFPYPFNDNQFDLVICFHVLEHLIDVGRVMEEICRITKKGGVIAIEVPYFSGLEAYKMIDHLHFFTSESFDVFHPEKGLYNARFLVEGRKIYFDDISRMAGIERFANWRMGFYERRLAHILPARVIYYELRVVK